MEKEYFVVTDNSYFHLGVSSLIQRSSEGNIAILPFDFNLKKNAYNELGVFIVYFDDMISNFKALLFFENLNSDVMFFSRSQQVVRLCSKFGFSSVKVKEAMNTNVMFRERNRIGDKKKVLSYMEWQVITKLLDGDSNIKLARKTKLSDKTISHHKRSALFKVGVRDINLFFDNINKDIFKFI